MLSVLSITDDVKFAVLDLLRDIGMGIVDIIFSTIDTLYEVGNTINSLNLITMLQEIDNSPFTKIFNAFFILGFAILFLFSVWKITFRIIDADSNEQPIAELIKEIIKCGFLIFSVVLIFNTTINIGINLSSAIYNNFNTKDSSIGDKMESTYLTINEQCYIKSGNEKEDKKNVNELKDYLSSYANLKDVETTKDFESKIRNGVITSDDIVDSGAFSYRCDTNDKEEYIFEYNFLFGIIIGIIFLVAIGFAILSLGKRQLELAFLMVISPIVFASSVGRKEQRSALYQQLASLVLQAGAIMLLIGLTSITFNAIQNSEVINNMDYFSKTVTQSILVLGCATLLMMGCNSINRFVGDNVAANNGRDMMMAMNGIGSFAGGLAGGTIGGVVGAGRAARGTFGLGQLAVSGMANRQNKMMNQNPDKFKAKTHEKAGKGINNILKGEAMKTSKNPMAKGIGAIYSGIGKSQYNSSSKKWDFAKDEVNKEYQDHLSKSSERYAKGKQNIAKGYGRIGRRRYYR